MKYPFEANPEELKADPGRFVDAVVASLESEFLIMPKGPGFIEYPVFEDAYEELKRTTAGFVRWQSPKVTELLFERPVVFLVIRAILGFTPSEWAYVASAHTGAQITQGAARSIDRRIRLKPSEPLPGGAVTRGRVSGLVEAACHLLRTGPPILPATHLHRLDKADTRRGVESLKDLAQMGFPYAMVLYERFLGRPFAGHRDSVSEIVGDALESAIEEILVGDRVSYRKTRRAERLEGFDQAPDFVIPSEFNIRVVIEAKITEDDGTARDKVTRVQHLAQIARAGAGPHRTPFQVIACISGRGFAERREDMKKLILATGGKVFTPRTLHRMVACTDLARFVSSRPSQDPAGG